mmetsp:Transcript_330/g.605  ORF Transcript_330/g.605 Transcript_330/m.605 type:complete len:789 (+) Transcript_330:1-2367(+)
MQPGDTTMPPQGDTTTMQSTMPTTPNLPFTIDNGQGTAEPTIPGDTTTTMMPPPTKPPPNMSNMSNMTNMSHPPNMTNMSHPPNMTMGNGTGMNMSHPNHTNMSHNMTMPPTPPPSTPPPDGPGPGMPNDDDDMDDHPMDPVHARCEYGRWEMPVMCVEAPCGPYMPPMGHHVVHGHGEEHHSWRVIGCAEGYHAVYPMNYTMNPMNMDPMKDMNDTMSQMNNMSMAPPNETDTVWCDRGMWKHPPGLSCEPMPCGPYMAMMDVMVTSPSPNMTMHEHNITIACAPGYTAVNEPMEYLGCMYGRWHNRTLQCAPDNCPAFPDAGPRYTVQGSGEVHGSWRAVSCQAGYVSSTDQPVLVHCDKGQWGLLTLECIATTATSTVAPQLQANVTGSMTLNIDVSNGTDAANLTQDTAFLDSIIQAIIDSLLADGIEVNPQDIVLDVTVARRLGAAEFTGAVRVRGGAAAEVARRLQTAGLVVNYVVQTSDAAVAESVQSSINGGSSGGGTNTSAFQNNLLTNLQQSSGQTIASVDVAPVELVTQTTTTTTATPSVTSTTTGCPLATLPPTTPVVTMTTTSTTEGDGLLPFLPAGQSGLAALITILGCLFLLLVCCAAGICVLVQTQRQSDKEEDRQQAFAEELKAAEQQTRELELKLKLAEADKLRATADDPSRLQGNPPVVVEGKAPRSSPVCNEPAQVERAPPALTNKPHKPQPKPKAHQIQPTREAPQLKPFDGSLKEVQAPVSAWDDAGLGMMADASPPGVGTRRSRDPGSADPETDLKVVSEDEGKP